MDREISTREAAELLNVSEPYLVNLVEAGKFLSRVEGADRRIRVADAMEYKARLDAEAEQACAELVRQGQELRMGYG